jgi:putative phosphoesterase
VSCDDGTCSQATSQVSTRIAVLSDVHGNLGALEAVRKALKKEKPDVVLIAGDLVMNGPEPAGTIDAIREMEGSGAIVVQGNTDVAVADADYAAAFPFMLESGIPDALRAAAEWAHDALEDEHLAWLRRLPAERRIRIGEDLVLVTHASPGSQTQGFDQNLDPATVVERMSRTDARVICCGHTHIPEVREFGWKLIVNDGSAGYAFDGDPTASWALVTMDDDDVTAEIRRTEYDILATANAISARGLPGDVYRAATVRTGKLVR